MDQDQALARKNRISGYRSYRLRGRLNEDQGRLSGHPGHKDQGRNTYFRIIQNSGEKKETCIVSHFR